MNVKETKAYLAREKRKADKLALEEARRETIRIREEERRKTLALKAELKLKTNRNWVETVEEVVKTTQPYQLERISATKNPKKTRQEYYEEVKAKAEYNPLVDELLKMALEDRKKEREEKAEITNEMSE